MALCLESLVPTVRRWRSVSVMLLAAAVAGPMAQPAASQGTFPERNITLIVPFAAGGASDVSSRIMAEALAKILGQSVIVENVAGAGGGTGGLRAKNAKPDGYTIAFGHMGTHAAAVSTNAKLPYDPTKDFDYLGIHLVTPHIMITRKDLPPTTLQEYISFAKEKGKGLKIAHNGAGSLSHLTCVVFFSQIGVEPTYVVYRGYGQVINDILSGAVDGTCELIASTRNHVLPGAVKGFGAATNDGRRTPLLPDVPSSAEGGLPSFKIESWLGLYVPKGVPEPILAKLRAAQLKALDDPEVQKKFQDIGGVVPKPEDRGGDRMLAIVKADVDRWAEVAAKAGVVKN